MFVPSMKTPQIIAEVGRTCVVCQAHQYPNFQVHGPIAATPMSPELGTSWSQDLFMMPALVWKSQAYDCMLVCVDRLSGWMIVLPFEGKGLTAEPAARAVVERWWQPFGILAVITSDQGPQFAGAFWRTICAQLGVRTAFAQAYHPQANGRAEVAGKTFKSWLRKIVDEEYLCWVELIPYVLQRYHDIPRVSGMSMRLSMEGNDRWGDCPMKYPEFLRMLRSSSTE